MTGILPESICTYFPESPIIWICFVPVAASVNVASIEGFVSKLSARLQHAAFLNSSWSIIFACLGSILENV